ncbi:MAG: transcriptional repressor [Endomicrobiales bacterium]|nr:transcriptional repressor [Endomicrobiales bacterium]
MITNMESINNKLLSKNVRPTYQRMKILEYLEKNQNHPTVDMIYRYLLKEIPTISKTTVYNTLTMLFEKGLVSCLNITGTESRFDCYTGNHHHFLCEKCGNIIDLDVKCPIADKKKFQGHVIKELHGYFKGICKKCLENQK